MKPKQQALRVDADLADVFLQTTKAAASSVAPKRRRLLKKSKM
jgi:hypothetical protein